MSDISELFSRDPLSLTKSDRALIIAEYRDKRERYMLGQKITKVAAKKAPKVKTPGGLSLDDLDEAPTGAATLSLEDLE